MSYCFSQDEWISVPTPVHHNCHSLPAASDTRQWLVNSIMPPAQLLVICRRYLSDHHCYSDHHCCLDHRHCHLLLRESGRWWLRPGGVSQWWQQCPTIDCPYTKHQEAGSQVALPFSSARSWTDHIPGVCKCEFRELQTFGSGMDPVSGCTFIQI